MPIQIQAPDNSIIEFPDGTPDATITSVMAKAYPAPKPAGPQVSATQQRANADAAKRAATTPGLVRAVSNGFAFNAAGNLDALSAAAETGLHNAFAHATGQPDSGYGMQEAFNAVRGAEANASNAFAKAHPVQNVLANVAGAVANPVNRSAAGYVGRAGSLGQTVARSAGTGAVLGAAYGAGGTQPGQNPIAQAGQGAVVGAATGAALPVAGRAAQVAGRAINNATGQRLMGPAAAAAGRLRQALQADGVDAQTINAAVSNYQRTGAMDPALADVAGENTRALLRYAGSRPGAARNMAQSYRDTTVESVPDASIGRAQQLTPNDPRSATSVTEGADQTIANAATPPNGQAGQGGAAVHAELNRRFDAANQAVNDAYAAARAAAPDQAHLPASSLPGLAAHIHDAISEFAPSAISDVRGVVGRLDATSTPTMRDLFEIRSQLSNLRVGTPTPQTVAAGRAVNALDAQINNAADRGLITGDPNVVGLWRNAINLRRQLGQQFEGNDLIQTLTERGVHGAGRTTLVAPEDASAAILGRGRGVSPRQDLTRDLVRLRDYLGADHPAWQALQNEASGRVLARDANPEAFGTAFGQLQRDNPELATTLISPNRVAQVGRAQLRIAGAVADRNAVGVGRGVLTQTPDEFASSLRNLTNDQLDTTRVGARQAITDALGQRANASPVLRQIAFAPNTQRNLTALFGEDEANRFIQAARLNLQKGDAANFIAPNTGSQTALREGDAQTFGNVFKMIRDPVRAVLEKFANGMTLTDREAEALVQMGISHPSDALRLLQGSATGRAANTLARYAGTAAAPVTASNVNLLARPPQQPN